MSRLGDTCATRWCLTPTKHPKALLSKGKSQSNQKTDWTSWAYSAPDCVLLLASVVVGSTYGAALPHLTSYNIHTICYPISHRNGKKSKLLICIFIYLMAFYANELVLRKRRDALTSATLPIICFAAEPIRKESQHKTVNIYGIVNVIYVRLGWSRSVPCVQ